jgi:hypothetical protein
VLGWGEEDQEEGKGGGFGVTPAVLSTGGAMLVLEALGQALGGDGPMVDRWLSGWGPTKWSVP